MEGQYESVVDEFLRDELNYVVVKSWDAADAGVRMLQTDVAGRATFLVHGEAHGEGSVDRDRVSRADTAAARPSDRGRGGAEGLCAGAEWLWELAGAHFAEAAGWATLRRIPGRRGSWRSKSAGVVFAPCGRDVS